MADEKDCCCGGVKLVFACSGASDVGEIADHAGRKLSREGAGKMFCLTGIGGRVETITKFAKAADKIVAIDGCALECARHCLEEAGFKGFEHLHLGQLGLEKGKSPATDESVDRVAAAARERLAC